jgi:hypothetical protein
MTFKIFIKNETEKQFYERVEKRLKTKVDDLRFKLYASYDEYNNFTKLISNEKRYKKLIDKNKSDEKKKEFSKKLNKQKKEIRKLIYHVFKKLNYKKSFILEL